MNVKELGNYCNSINIACARCKYMEYCNDFVEKMAILTEGITPCGLLNFANNLEEYELKE